MSFKSRAKKRAAIAAQHSAQRAQREQHADRHYLTLVSRPTCCNHGGERLRKGDECVFRFQPKEILCLNCATVLGIKYRPSLGWEKRKGRPPTPST